MANHEEVVSNKKSILRHLRLNGYYEIYKRNTYPAFVQAIEELKKDGLIFQGSEKQNNFYFPTKLLPRTIQVRCIDQDKIQTGDRIGFECERLDNVTNNYFEVDCSVYESLGVFCSIELVQPRRTFKQFMMLQKTDKEIILTTHKNGKDLVTVINAETEFYKEK